MYSFKIICFLTVSLWSVNIEAPSVIGSSDFDTSIGSGMKKYDPLYVIYKNNQYSFVKPPKYHSVMREHEYGTSQDEVKMLAACTKENTPTNEALLEIAPADEETLHKGYQCDTPIKYFAKKESKASHFTIGFMIYDKKGDSSHIHFLPNTPKDQFPIPLIRIAYKTVPRIQSITSWHTIKYTDMLPIDEESNQYSQNNSIYEKNIDIYGYDIDPAYIEENQQKFSQEYLDQGSSSTSKLVKLQLAPSADFYFDAWKSATRSNINTMPIWQELVEEWRQLERFIRQVAKVLGDLRVITGGSYPPIKSELDTTATNVLPFYEPSVDKSSKNKPLLMFQRLYKAVTFNQKRQNGEWIRYGILFIMMNDPHTTEHQYDEVARKNGWNYSTLHLNKWKTRFSAYELNYKTMVKLNIDNNAEIYEPFNLNEVIKLSRNEEQGSEEIETKVDVLRELGLKKMSRPIEDNVD